MNGIIYTRVSTKEQTEDRTSLETQEKECASLARKQDVLVPENNIYREEGESAKFANRTQLQNLLAYVRHHKGEIQFLYIWKIDRLSRNLSDYYGIKVALGRYGVKIVSVTEPIEDDPVGRFLEAILAAAAQFDNEIRAVRTISGMRARVEQGNWPHSAPIGYKKVNKSVVIDEKYAPKVTQILTTFAKGGYSLADITRYASELGIKSKSGKSKSIEAIKIILQNPFYAGFTRNKLSEKINKGLHKALVSEDVITTNIDIIDGTRKNYSYHGDDLYPLKNILLCSNCNKSLTASAPKSRNGSYYPSYTCNRKTCTKTITGKKTTTSIEIAHKQFRELLESFRPLDEGIARLYKDILVRAWNEQYKQSIDALSELNRKSERNKTLRFSTNRKFIEGKIDEQDKNAQIDTLDDELNKINEQNKELSAYISDSEEIIDKAMTFIETPDLFWNRAKPSVKKMIQLFMFPEGLVFDHETSFGTTYKLEHYLLLKKIADKSAKNSDLVAATGIEPVTLGL